jgi:tetratricopeptide (TPR) repeat protein
MATVAASLIFLLGITGLLTRESGTSDIYQDFYHRYESSGTSRSAGVAVNKAMAEALQKYEKQDYESALELFGQVLGQDPANMAGHFYNGVSLQETGKYSSAIQEYATVIVDKDNLFTEQAEWYTGLCYLQTNEEKKALKQFRKIAQREGFYQRKAQEILKKIKTSD